MKKRIVLKTFIPAVLLIVVLAALAFVSVYALLLKSSMAESYSEISSPTPASDTSFTEILASLFAFLRS